MKRERILLQGLAVFVVAALFYAGAYHWLEHQRRFKGPWQITFKTDESGNPSVSINQPALSIRDVTLEFEGEKAAANLSQTVFLDVSSTNAPFGKVLFFDTTFLPGTVTFDLFGHEIELMPRTMVVDHNEVPWRSGAKIKLGERDKRDRQSL